MPSSRRTRIPLCAHHQYLQTYALSNTSPFTLRSTSWSTSSSDTAAVVFDRLGVAYLRQPHQRRVCRHACAFRGFSATLIFPQSSNNSTRQLLIILLFLNPYHQPPLDQPRAPSTTLMSTILSSAPRQTTISTCNTLVKVTQCSEYVSLQQAKCEQHPTSRYDASTALHRPTKERRQASAGRAAA